MIKLCDSCGMELVKTAKSRYCPDCRKSATQEKKSALRELIADKVRREERMKYYHSDELIKAIAKADKLGISYGQYQAMQYTKMMNKKRKRRVEQ